MTIKPNKVRCLQQKLYERSKQEPQKRFYSLYDKIYQMDTLRMAYVQCRKNKGCAGIDGVTFEQIERQESGADMLLKELQQELKDKSYRAKLIKRVFIPKGIGPNCGTRPLGISTIRDRVIQTACSIVMQPIFEPHLHIESYGYRPQRNAQQAVRKIDQYLRRGYKQVLDADLAGYFDSIPHGRLMEKISKRISDKSLLDLLRQGIKTSIAEINGEGKAKIIANRIGTPQGSAISPLLANIYLNDFCKLVEKRSPCKIVSYADDFVVLSREQFSIAQFDWVEGALSREKLVLNRDKTRCVDMSQKGNEFNFLGFRFMCVKGNHNTRPYTKIEPSKKGQNKFKESIRNIVKHCTSQTLDVLVKRSNRVIRGWKQFFAAIGYPVRIFFKLSLFVVARFYRWSKRRSQRASKYLAQDAWKKLRQAGLEQLYPLEVRPM